MAIWFKFQRILAMPFLALISADANAVVQTFSASGGGYALILNNSDGLHQYSGTKSSLIFDPRTHRYNYDGGSGASLSGVFNSSTAFGQSASGVSASIGPSVTKAIVGSGSLVDYSGPAYRPPVSSSSYSNFAVRTLDRLTFDFASGVTSAILRVTTYVSNFLNAGTVVVVNNGFVTGSASQSGDWNYTHNLFLYDDDNHILGQSGAPKQVHSTIVGGNSSCSGQKCFYTGSYMEYTDYTIEEDDVMYISNTLQFSTNTRTTLTNGSGIGFARADRKYDFSNSGYTLLEIFTPGADYISDSGSRYLMKVPSTVPEPASWTMLISGFGLAGTAMRRLRLQGTLRHS